MPRHNRARKAGTDNADIRIVDNYPLEVIFQDRSEFLVFREHNESWVKFGDYTCRRCN